MIYILYLQSILVIHFQNNIGQWCINMNWFYFHFSSFAKMCPFNVSRWQLDCAIISIIGLILIEGKYIIIFSCWDFKISVMSIYWYYYISELILKISADLQLKVYFFISKNVICKFVGTISRYTASLPHLFSSLYIICPFPGKCRNQSNCPDSPMPWL